MAPALHRFRPLRRVVLPLLRAVSPGDIRIRHHWWPEARVRLDCYAHKGYWFHGRNRERPLMEMLADVVEPGDVVIDVGGHIGYVALRLRGLVGSEGRVVVFEPGRNNLPYLRANLAPYPNMEVVEAACSDVDGEAEFWIENETGQTNTLFGTRRRSFRRFSRGAPLPPIRTPTVRLDTFLAGMAMRPDLIKIDAEGAELITLQGAARCLDEHRPVLVIEVSAANHSAVEELLGGHRYAVRDRNRHGWLCVPV